MMTAYAPPSGVHVRECVAELKKAARLPQFTVPTIVTPAAFYALFAIGMGSGKPDAAAYSLATFGVFSAIGPALFGFGTGVAVERETGQLELKRVSPMPAGAHLAGKLVASLAFTAAALLLIYPLSLIAGARLGWGQWAMLAAVHLGSVIPFALLGLGLGYRLGSKGAVAAANALFLGFAVIGGLWMPIAVLPEVLQSLAWGTPSFHLGELALRAAGTPRATPALAHLAVLGALALAFGVFAWTGWRRGAA